MSSTTPRATDTSSNKAGVVVPPMAQPSTAQNARSRSSLSREVAIISLVATPFIVLPLLYFRRLRTLSDRVLEIKALQTEVLRQSTASSHRAGDRALEAVRAHEKSTGRDMLALRKDFEAIKVAANEQNENLARDVAAMRSEMKALSSRVQTVADKEPAVSLSAKTLDEMASSLVDVAAFVEEVETLEGLERRGTDPRGIQKMRQLALKLHSLAGAAPQDKNTTQV